MGAEGPGGRICESQAGWRAERFRVIAAAADQPGALGAGLVQRAAPEVAATQPDPGQVRGLEVGLADAAAIEAGALQTGVLEAAAVQVDQFEPGFAQIRAGKIAPRQIQRGIALFARLRLHPKRIGYLGPGCRSSGHQPSKLNSLAMANS